MEELDYRTYSKEQAIKHLPAMIYDILANNTEYHAREAFDDLVWDYSVEDERTLVLNIGMDDNTTRRVEISITKEEI